MNKLQFDVILKTARSLVLELKDCGCYTSEEEHVVYVNGVEAERSNKIVVSLFDLKPATAYEVQVKFADKESEVVTVCTENEFVTLDVKEFGAKGDNVNDDTLFIQCAINACPKGGRVLIPAGDYRITTLFLKSDL
ncbi:MAG: glycoside hydrolase family 28 protein, partial [Lachnospiraceae bacterium]|nr:glycoside hydrolase family 28 protein [Lachnospiraceae bacterium]